MTEHMSDEYAAEVVAAALAVEKDVHPDPSYEVPLPPDHPKYMDDLPSLVEPAPPRDEHDPANQNTTGVGTGLRADAGKLRYDLIPVGPLAELARVYTLGAIKYDDNNWRGGIAYENCVAAMMRHIERWRAGESFDPDGQHHMASVAFWAFAILQYERDGQPGNSIDLLPADVLRDTFAPVKV
jgi:hypothetical protein